MHTIVTDTLHYIQEHYRSSDRLLLGATLPHLPKPKTRLCNSFEAVFRESTLHPEFNLTLPSKLNPAVKKVAKSSKKEEKAPAFAASAQPPPPKPQETPPKKEQSASDLKHALMKLAPHLHTDEAIPDDAIAHKKREAWKNKSGSLK